MKTISENTKLSKIYTNHCIRKTTATGMYRQGYSLKEIANETKHKNLQSLEHYINGPNHQDKTSYLNALFDYSKKTDSNQKRQCDKKKSKTSAKEAKIECSQRKHNW